MIRFLARFRRAFPTEPEIGTPSGPVERLTIQRANLDVFVPCGGCIHRADCPIRPRLEAIGMWVSRVDDAVTVTGSLSADCSLFQAEARPRRPRASA